MPARENRESGVRPERTRHCYWEQTAFMPPAFAGKVAVCDDRKPGDLPVVKSLCGVKGDPMDDGKVHGLI